MFDVGDPVPLAVTVLAPSGAPGDATAVTCTVTLPDGAAAALAVTHDGTGLYSALYVPTQVGRHVVRWVATGTNASAFTDVFLVADSLAPLVSLSDLRTHLRKGSTASDEELRWHALVATELAEEWLGYVVRRTAVTGEQHDGGRSAVLLLRGPVESVTAVTVAGTALASTAWKLDRTAGILHHAYGTFGGSTLDVVVDYVAAPTSGLHRYSQGVREIVRHLWDTQRGGSQIPRQQGAGDEWASESGWSVPRRVMELLGTRAPGIA